ncbi:MAG: sigma-E processing peptidase SpoIIGA [Acetatifactor sp.]|nr:sigma-E processing peptidase SpoIIGA [Acetatifactor sp.]
MVYEIYADRLFLTNFVMNLYVLSALDHFTFRTATGKRLVAGACLGALGYLLPFLLPGPIWVRLIPGLLIGMFGMLQVTFRIQDPGNFVGMYGKGLLCTFVFSGISLTATSFLEILFGRGIGSLMVPVCGGIVLFFLNRRESQQIPEIVKVTIPCGEKSYTVNALVDSGNSLTEPISGQPAAVLSEDLFQELFPGESAGFRVIPYETIEHKRGILRAYLLPKIQVELHGMKKEYEKIYVAEMPGTSTYSLKSGEIRMILSPVLLSNTRQYGRIVRRYGTEGSYARKIPGSNVSEGAYVSAPSGRDPLHRRNGNIAGALGGRAGNGGDQ